MVKLQDTLNHVVTNERENEILQDGDDSVCYFDCLPCLCPHQQINCIPSVTKWQICFACSVLSVYPTSHYLIPESRSIKKDLGYSCPLIELSTIWLDNKEIRSSCWTDLKVNCWQFGVMLEKSENIGAIVTVGGQLITTIYYSPVMEKRSR